VDKIFRVYLTKQAETEALEAKAFYQDISPALGNTFAQNLEARLQQLKTQWGYQIRYKKVRCVGIKKFPYLLHYVVYEKAGTVRVVSVKHMKRKSEL
jgi:plasmid stabilization system protein ParE